MKLNYDKKSKDPTYFVQKGFRLNGKCTTQNIYRIGRHSELIKEGYNDPLAYAMEVVKSFNDKENQAKENNLAPIFDPLILENDDYEMLLYNIGYLFLDKIYDSITPALDVDKASLYKEIIFKNDNFHPKFYNLYKEKNSSMQSIKNASNILMSILMGALENKGYSFKRNDVVKALANINVLYEEKYLTATYNSSQILDALVELTELNLKYKYYKIKK